MMDKIAPNHLQINLLLYMSVNFSTISILEFSFITKYNVALFGPLH